MEQVLTRGLYCTVDVYQEAYNALGLLYAGSCSSWFLQYHYSRHAFYAKLN